MIVAAPPPPIAPPIRAVHRTMRAGQFGTALGQIGGHCVRPPCSLRKKIPRARQPASPSTAVHVRAELRLASPPNSTRRALFVTFRSKGLGTCFALVRNAPLEQLACADPAGCRDICLSRSEESSGLFGRKTAIVGGTVSARAHRLRMHFARGSPRTYALKGPLVGGRRIFMADLGTLGRPSRVELLE